MTLAPEQKNNSTLFDSLADAYDAWFDADGRVIFQVEAEAFKPLAPAFPRPWVEIGVGSGRFAQALGIDSGIDPSARLVELARKRGVKASVSCGEDHYFKESSTGSVFLIVTLCFLEHPAAVFCEINHILQPDGKVILGIVLRESPWGQMYLLKKSQGHRFYSHAIFYSYSDIEKLLDESGFRIERVASTLFQKPGEDIQVECPVEGYTPEAGFSVIVARKISNSHELK
jgi:SAM-dependent methyltransferase